MLGKHWSKVRLLKVLDNTNESCSFSPLDHACFAYYSLVVIRSSIFAKCNMIETTPQNLLDCVALVYDDLLKRPDLVLEVIKANDLMDLI
ncbi:hypothetical protein AVEN_113406-1 [Araneus ventricosus]|uniref:Uncharacterized protein n=1 Tax=Araneus ventricosus TaxID=182803 RepID=A0A4Y2I0C2_ARAVE|nr:hypothetical protein AVEN_113406-1 [Araneus ventricosus]